MKNSRSPGYRVPLGILGLTFATFGCASGGGAADVPEQPLGAVVDALAEELIQAARQRVDLSSMRVCLREVTEIQTDDPPPLPAYLDPADLDHVAEEITEELELALSSRIHLIDSDLFGEPPRPLELNSRESGSRVAQHFGATHLAVCTIAPHGDQVQLKLRLVDAGNWVIIAVARGTVPVEALSDRSRVALGDLPPYRGPDPLRDDSPGERMFADSSLAAGPEGNPASDWEVATAPGVSLPPQPGKLETVDSGGAPSDSASWKPPEKPLSDRTELDRLIHARAAFWRPALEHETGAAKARVGPAEARVVALGRGLR